MSMFYLERDTYPSTIECPECHAAYEVNWWTEYGEPINGKHDVTCPSCAYEFVMIASSFIGYTTELKETKNER